MSKTDSPNGNNKYSKVPTLALLSAIVAMATYFGSIGLRTVTVLERLEIRMGIQSDQASREHAALADSLRRIEKEERR